MPQHDLDVANGTGAAVRADINAALVALGSSMKGPNAPPAPIAGMMWVDDNEPSTTIWTLKVYDGADWLAIGTLDSTANRFDLSSRDAGMIGMFPFAAPPVGWLRADGSLVSRSAYPVLFAAALADGLVSEAVWSAGSQGRFSSGDGSTTFRLPDLRGEFLRGFDDGRGVDAGRARGTQQGHALQQHQHSGVAASAAAVLNNATGPGGITAFTNNTGNVAAGANTATETRPRNIALLVCIKH